MRASILAALLVVSCDMGGGGGGGPASTTLPARSAFRPESVPADPTVRGAGVFRARGCVLCHGDAGKGGVDNENSETGGKIAGLTLVKEGYTQQQLEERIRDGVPEVGRKDAAGPLPPLRMPAYGAMLSAREIGDLAAYLLALYPREREAQDDWDDEEEDEGGTEGASDGEGDASAPVAGDAGAGP